MVIRRAQEKDLPGLISLLEQVLMVHYEGRPDLFKPYTRKYTDAELHDIIADDERPIFVAVADNAPDGEILGYAFCVYEDYAGNNNMTDHRTLYIDDICVDEHARGQHVGTSVYQYVIDFARAEGFYNVTLNVWTCNPGAQAFYEAMGMKPYKVGMETIL
ncbi:MAG: GNAT family N-acetyltransferase [Coriobacteriales bacterium]|nr:GNAT family N-acetyltransferase [Coriobacteriales bacterium]MDO5709776.1 GNAT family N-acetyltransferase [Coriobacteriales bacterium]